MALDLYAGICVSTSACSAQGRPSSRTRLRPFGDLAEGRSIFVLEDAERAGHALQTIFVDDLDSLVSEIASRDLSPAERETYSNGVMVSPPRSRCARPSIATPTGTRSASATRPAERPA